METLNIIQRRYCLHRSHSYINKDTEDLMARYDLISHARSMRLCCMAPVVASSTTEEHRLGLISHLYGQLIGQDNGLQIECKLQYLTPGNATEMTRIDFQLIGFTKTRPVCPNLYDCIKEKIRDEQQRTVQERSILSTDDILFLKSIPTWIHGVFC